MTERELQRAVINLAKQLGWTVAHFGNTVKIVRRGPTDYRTIPDPDAQGFPDLVLVRKGKLLFAELKSKRGKLTPSQDIWLGELERTGARTYLWRPEDWEAGAIEEALR